MLEMFILTLCIQGYECNALTKAYLSHNKEVKIGLRSAGKRTEKVIGKEATFVTLVAYTAVGSKKLRLRLPYNTVAEWNFKQDEQKQVNLAWRYDF